MTGCTFETPYILIKQTLYEKCDCSNLLLKWATFRLSLLYCFIHKPYNVSDGRYKIIWYQYNVYRSKNDMILAGPPGLPMYVIKTSGELSLLWESWFLTLFYKIILSKVVAILQLICIKGVVVSMANIISILDLVLFRYWYYVQNIENMDRFQ